MIKNIIFDIGNVLMSFDPNTYFQTVFQEENLTNQVCHAIFTHEAWLKYDQGIYQIEDLMKVYHKEFPHLKKEIDFVLKNWLLLMNPISTSLSLMKELKAEGYQIYLLSNLSKDSADYLKETQSFFDEVDGAVLSYEEKLIKPDARIYEVLLNRYQLQPSQCLFIDDRKENIETAMQSGMHGIVLNDSSKIKEAVREYLERVTC